MSDFELYAEKDEQNKKFCNFFFKCFRSEDRLNLPKSPTAENHAGTMLSCTSQDISNNAILLRILEVLKEIRATLNIDVVGIKEELNSLSVSIAIIQSRSPMEDDSQENLMFEGLYKLPVKTMEQLYAIEEDLTSNLQFRRYLSKYIQNMAGLPLIGDLSGKGKDFSINKTVNGMCSAVMVDEVGVNFSMKGRSEERQSFEAKFSQIINVVLDAMQIKFKSVNHPLVDLQTVKRSTGEWLWLSKSRTNEGKSRHRLTHQTNFFKIFRRA